MPAHILVAGGGIGGMAAALALARQGHRLDVLEQAPAFGEIGAGVQLGPNATKRLHSLGLSRALDGVAATPTALVVRDAGSGSELARLLLADAVQQRYGAPYLCLHRADLHGLLLAGVRSHAGVTLASSARVAGVQSSDDLVCVSSTDARAWEGDALIGADGLWSTVRSQVDASAAPPRATGHTAWRALVEQSTLPAALRRQQVDVWLGPRLHAVAYPVRGGGWLNVVVIAEASPAGDAQDWDQASSLAALQLAIGQCGAML
jgi:salicylate hydroxylase